MEMSLETLVELDGWMNSVGLNFLLLVEVVCNLVVVVIEEMVVQEDLHEKDFVHTKFVHVGFELR